MNIVWKGSPNFNKGRTKPIRKIVIHWFGLGTLESANARFQNPAADTSAHYGISKGRIWQWVKETDVAWHSGVWNTNQESIGIEHDAVINHHNLSDQDYELSAQLVAEISKRHNIALNRTTVIGHREVKNTACPGTIDLNRIITRANEILKPMYPIIVRVKTVINNYSYDIKSAFLQTADWYKTNSQNKINIVFDFEEMIITPVPFYDGHVDDTWYAEKVLPKALGYDISLLMLSEWHGTTGTWGWMRGDSPQKTMKAEVYTEEWALSQLHQLISHEISHALFYLSTQNSFDPTHQYFIGDHTNAHKIFDLLNYEHLNKSFNERRQEPMLIINNTSNPNTKFAISSDAKIGFADLTAYQKFTAGRQVVVLTLPDAEFNKIPTSQAVIKT